MISVSRESLDKMTAEEALEQLKKTSDMRNRMCGVMYWNILNDECCQIANKCAELGVSKQQIYPLLGEGNFVGGLK